MSVGECYSFGMGHEKDATWFEEPFTLLAVQCNYGWDSLENLRYAQANGFDGEQLLHVFTEGHMAYYDDARDSEKLRGYLAHSRKAGMRQIVYFNTHCITRPMRDAHPDWVQLDKDGNDIAAYGTFYLNCISGGWFDGLFRDNIAALSTWRRIDELDKMVTFVVLSRAEPDTPYPYQTIRRRIDISATEIRQRIANGASIRYLVPDKVHDLILRNNLYQ